LQQDIYKLDKPCAGQIIMSAARRTHRLDLAIIDAESRRSVARAPLEKSARIKRDAKDSVNSTTMQETHGELSWIGLGGASDIVYQCKSTEVVLFACRHEEETESKSIELPNRVKIFQ
jgi:hypothetical protein